MKIEFNEEIIKTETCVTNEDKVEIHMTKAVKKIEKYAVKGVAEKTTVEVFYDGLIKDYKRITRGEENHWVEYSDYTMSYGSGSYSQRYSRDLDWFTDVVVPVIIHCEDGDIEENVHYEGLREQTWN